jgi:nicotinate-nucleotide adenylyltransferase
MKLGILGGTFNPVHIAHLRIAEEVRERLALDRIIFIPAATPPHKQLDGEISFADRKTMVELAIAGNQSFTVSDIEEQRGGRSYSVDTLRELYRLYPDDDLYFIIGSDSFLEISSWYSSADLFSLANIVVVERPEAIVKELTAPLPLAIRDEFCYGSDKIRLTHRSGFSVFYLPGTPLPISSSDIRRAVREGRSIRYLVPEKVAGYISDKRIYLNDR